MKKFFGVGVLFVLIIAVVTVPSKQQYTDWLKDEIKKESGSQLVNLGVDLLGSPLINSTTSCKNLVFINICKTNISDSESISAIGLLNNFFGLHSHGISSDDQTQVNETTQEETTPTPMVTPQPSTTDIKPALSSNRVYIRNFKTDDKLNKTIEWTFDDIHNDKTLSLSLTNNKKATLVLGVGHPNTFRFQVFFEEEKIGYQLPIEDNDEFVLENDELIDANLTVQATTYDFGDSESGEKIIIAISDGIVTGKFWVVSYTPVNDLTKVDPFHLELSGNMQDKIWIDGNKLYTPIGGNNRIDVQYEWLNHKFYTTGEQ